MNQYEMLRNVSRTFTLSIEQLPQGLRDVVTIAYLLFRISDCLEDNDCIDGARKVRLLKLWVQVLRGSCSSEELSRHIDDLDSSDPEVYVAQHANHLIDLLHRLPPRPANILAEHVIDTSLGMAHWLERGPYVETEQEMDDYMHQVAGRVGYMLTELFAWYSPAISKLHKKLMPLGQEFGLALQTVNIIRGLRKDFERGWIFVPATFCGKVGLTREDFFDPRNSERALQVIEMLSNKAEGHLRKGLAYIKLLPRRHYKIRLFCIWPLMFAAKTLAISRNNVSVLTDEAKITRHQVKRIMILSKIFLWSNTCLTAYFKLLCRTGRAD